MFSYDVYEVVLGDQSVFSHLGLLFFSPLLLIEMGRIEKLWGNNGPCGFNPAHNAQEQPFVVVVEEGDGCSSVS